MTTEDDYDDACLLSGIWRLGLLRNQVLEVLAAREPTPRWPLFTPDRRASPEWRLRVELWRRTQPEGKAEANLRAKPEAAWREAVAAKDTKLAGRVAEATPTWIGTEAADALASDAQTLARDVLVTKEARAAARRDVGLDDGLLYLLERFGVPEGMDITTVAAATQRYYEKMRDESAS